jgi:transposase-like protein
MANRNQTKMSIEQRRKRKFSESFKIQKVRDLEMKKVSIQELCKVYEVSETSIRRWIDKYGQSRDKPERIVVETDSDTREILALRKKVAELERLIGQKQILLEFKDKMIEIAEDMYGVDINKKLSTKPSSTSGATGKNTESK